jgi:transposase
MARKRREYSREFKLEAVRLVREGGLTVSQAARDLGIHQTLLGRWKKQFEESPVEAFPGKGHLRPQDEELARLRRENEILRQERDILKKAVGIFSRVPK